MHNLPDDIKRLIWEYDNTYQIKYKTCIKHLKESKKMHIIYKKSSYNKLRRSDILPFSKFVLKRYINHQYSRSLFKWYYSNFLTKYLTK
jgi:hypothetical protein|tara:strand:+ start:934 stop:1200 length:267 start_codon:yes stop_codon:yes gene_type:complete